MEPTPRRLTGSGGVDLHLLEWSREGVPLMLVHGFGNEAHIWDDFAPIAAPHYRVLALDLRGHGDSDWALHGEYEYAHHVADLEAVTEGLGIERMVLVGHSLGGRVAMLYAAAHPEQMAGLVIVDSAPDLDARGTTRIQLDVGQHKDPSFGSVAEFETTLLHSYPEAQPHAIKRMAHHGLKQRDDGRYILKMDPALRGAVAQTSTPAERAQYEERIRGELWDALKNTPCPTLVVRGAASDIMSADVADKMVEDVLPKGRLAVVPQAGHSVMTDNPKGFREAVSGFILGEN